MIHNELEDLRLLLFILSTNLAHENMNYYLTWFTLRLFFMQDGTTPAFIASIEGHTETVALLLANKADINLATKVAV